MGRMKFVIGGVLILAVVVFLVVTATQANAQYFMTVDELKAKGQAVSGQDLRVSGAVVGDSIQYDPNTLTLSFVVAQVPNDNRVIDAQGGLAAVLHAAVVNPAAARLSIVYSGPKPDLLKNEAQAIMTGHLDSAGVFHADELLLKCPTKYQNAVPNQATGS